MSATKDLRGADTRLFAHAGLAFGGDELESLADTPISDSQVLELAEQMTGLTDWGPDDSFRVGLRILCDSIERMDPPAAWRHSFRRQIVHFLNQRLHMRDDEVRHPEILDEQISSPIMIVGVPRSGTTITHELLSLDPNARAPKNWEYAAPWPAPDVATFETDPRIAKVDESWRLQRKRSPELEHMLPMDANMPSECNDSMMFHFAGPNYWAWFRVPEHRDWTAAGTAPGLYRTHKRILQELQWKGPRGQWTCKSPGFIGDLEAIVETYPDARLVWTHRDPATTIISLSSLVASLQNALLGEYPDLHTMGAQTRDLWLAELKRGLAARKNPAVERAIVDVPYSELVADKAGTVAKLYERWGVEFTDEHRQRIGLLEAAQPSSHFAKHRYSAEDFGVEPESVREQLDEYYAAYGELC